MENAATNQDIGSEEFLQISANIVGTFGNRLPVALCIQDEKTQRVTPLFDRDTRLSDKKKKKSINTVMKATSSYLKLTTQILPDTSVKTWERS